MPFPNIGPGELILILIIALIVLGPGRLPDVAASLGKSVREFRKAATDVTEAARLDAAPSTPPSTPALNAPTDASPPTTSAQPAAAAQPAAPASAASGAVPASGAAAEPDGDPKPS